jgi:phage recombination protein Bet
MTITALQTTPAKALSIGRQRYSATQLDLIKRVCAKDTSADEFDQYISVCGSLGLDPLRRQVFAVVYKKDDPKKRSMTLIVSVDGLRSIASRSGTYRPGPAPEIVIEKNAVDADRNPLGIVSAEASVWRFAHGKWYEHTARVYWDEYAPCRDLWAFNETTGREEPSGRIVLDRKKDFWIRMPRHMLGKCAEAAALRKGWPELAGVYEQAEMDKAAVLDLSPSEYADQGGRERRQARIGSANTILFDWLDQEGLVPTPIGKITDKIAAFVKEHPDQGAYFAEVNRHPLREFWTLSPSDAFEAKRLLEQGAKTKPTPGTQRDQVTDV